MSARGSGLRLLAPTLVLLLVACGGGGDGSAEAASGAPPGEAEASASAEVGMTESAVCAPSARELAPDATLAGMAGEYRLVMVRSVEGSAEEAQAEGTLTLFVMPDSLSTLARSATPLGGTTTVDVERVGAQRVGELDSAAPDGPGVLVLESDGASGRSILLRFGSVANRRDLTPFDGGYTVLEVGRVTESAFFGSWRSAAQGPRTDGFFCAWRRLP